MSKVAIVTDSNSGITQYQAKELGIAVIPMPFTIDGATYYEDINLTRTEFFQHLEEGHSISTSQPLPADVLKIWDELLTTHDEIVHIPMSSGLSGSCQTAYTLSGEYNGKVMVVNNQRISVTQRASVRDAMAMAEKGYSALEIKEKLEEVKFDSSIYIMLDTLQYLKQGGRITPAAAAIGSLLRIKPVLQIKGERLDAFAKVRNTKAGRTTMITAMQHDMNEYYGGMESETCHLYAVHAWCPERLAEFKAEVEAAFPAFHVNEDMLSLSVCCHIGPGAIALACSKKLDIA